MRFLLSMCQCESVKRALVHVKNRYIVPSQQKKKHTAKDDSLKKTLLNLINSSSSTFSVHSNLIVTSELRALTEPVQQTNTRKTKNKMSKSSVYLQVPLAKYYVITNSLESCLGKLTRQHTGSIRPLQQVTRKQTNENEQREDRVCPATFSDLFWHCCRTAASFLFFLSSFFDGADAGIRYAGAAETHRQAGTACEPPREPPRRRAGRPGGRDQRTRSEEDGDREEEEEHLI